MELNYQLGQASWLGERIINSASKIGLRYGRKILEQNTKHAGSHEDGQSNQYKVVLKQKILYHIMNVLLWVNERVTTVLQWIHRQPLRLKIPIWIGIAAVTLLLVITLLELAFKHCCCCCKAAQQRRRSRNQRQNSNDEVLPLVQNSYIRIRSNTEGEYLGSVFKFKYHVLEEATDNFSDQFIIGEGGFGKVYQGQLKDGTNIAVKIMRNGGSQGEKEFYNETFTLMRVRHPNLVTMIGVCVEGEQRITVFELIQNGNLRKLLQQGQSNWKERLRIAHGAAQGLAFLHHVAQPPIIHRDVKSTNVLLDEVNRAKISDFGLVCVVKQGQHGNNGQTQLMGTFGYIAPEYLSKGTVSTKTDVYAFGIVLLEIISGQQPIDPTRPNGQVSLAQWLGPNLRSPKDLIPLIDPRLTLKDVQRIQVCALAEIAHDCIYQEPDDRPDMCRVVEGINQILQSGDPWAVNIQHNSIKLQTSQSIYIESGQSQYSRNSQKIELAKMGESTVNPIADEINNTQGVNPSNETNKVHKSAQKYSGNDAQNHSPFNISRIRNPSMEQNYDNEATGTNSMPNAIKDEKVLQILHMGTISDVDSYGQQQKQSEGSNLERLSSQIKVSQHEEQPNNQQQNDIQSPDQSFSSKGQDFQSDTIPEVGGSSSGLDASHDSFIAGSSIHGMVSELRQSQDALRASQQLNGSKRYKSSGLRVSGKIDALHGEASIIEDQEQDMPHRYPLQVQVLGSSSDEEKYNTASSSESGGTTPVMQIPASVRVSADLQNQAARMRNSRPGSQSMRNIGTEDSSDSLEVNINVQDRMRGSSTRGSFQLRKIPEHTPPGSARQQGDNDVVQGGNGVQQGRRKWRVLTRKQVRAQILNATNGTPNLFDTESSTWSMQRPIADQMEKNKHKFGFNAPQSQQNTTVSSPDMSHLNEQDLETSNLTSRPKAIQSKYKDDRPGSGGSSGQTNADKKQFDLSQGGQYQPNSQGTPSITPRRNPLRNRASSSLSKYPKTPTPEASPSHSAINKSADNLKNRVTKSPGSNGNKFHRHTPSAPPIPQQQQVYELHQQDDMRKSSPDLPLSPRTASEQKLVKYARNRIDQLEDQEYDRKQKASQQDAKFGSLYEEGYIKHPTWHMNRTTPGKKTNQRNSMSALKDIQVQDGGFIESDTDTIEKLISTDTLETVVNDTSMIQESNYNTSIAIQNKCDQSSYNTPIKYSEAAHESSKSTKQQNRHKTTPDSRSKAHQKSAQAVRQTKISSYQDRESSSKIPQYQSKLKVNNGRQQSTQGQSPDKSKLDQQYFMKFKSILPQVDSISSTQRVKGARDWNLVANYSANQFGTNVPGKSPTRIPKGPPNQDSPVRKSQIFTDSDDDQWEQESPQLNPTSLQSGSLSPPKSSPASKLHSSKTNSASKGSGKSRQRSSLSNQAYSRVRQIQEKNYNVSQCQSPQRRASQIPSAQSTPNRQQRKNQSNISQNKQAASGYMSSRNGSAGTYKAESPQVMQHESGLAYVRSSRESEDMNKRMDDDIDEIQIQQICEFQSKELNADNRHGQGSSSSDSRKAITNAYKNVQDLAPPRSRGLHRTNTHNSSKGKSIINNNTNSIKHNKLWLADSLHEISSPGASSTMSMHHWQTVHEALLHSAHPVEVYTQQVHSPNTKQKQNQLLKTEYHSRAYRGDNQQPDEQAVKPGFGLLLAKHQNGASPQNSNNNSPISKLNDVKWCQNSQYSPESTDMSCQGSKLDSGCKAHESPSMQSQKNDFCKLNNNLLIPFSGKKNSDSSCVICMDQPRAYAVVPCGHKVACKSCVTNQQNFLKECPICRAEVQGYAYSDITNTFVGISMLQDVDGFKQVGKQS